MVSQTLYQPVVGLAHEPKIVALLNKHPKATTIPANEKSKTGTNIAAPNLCSFCIIIHSPHKKGLIKNSINKSSLNKSFIY